MITFSDFVALAGEQEPALKVNRAASAFLSLSGFSALIVTAASPKPLSHQVMFSTGYTNDCVEHVRSSYIFDNPHYQQIKTYDHPLGWHLGFERGFEARTWLIPAGYRNGSSISLQDEAGSEIGSVHTNTRKETLSDRQIEALHTLRLFLTHTLKTQLDIERLGVTGREIQVIRCIVDGDSNPEIAKKLFISKRTVATHIENILRKLSAHSRVEVAVAALRLGLV